MTGPDTAAADEQAQPPAPPEPADDAGPGTTAVRATAGAGLVLAALGVVFGDIGTSPLYALETVFSIDDGAVRPTPEDVYGVISLMFWSITLIVSVKYVGVVMRADNDGEGGVMALAALARRLYSGRMQHSGLLLVLGIVGVSLFYGDSLITPAISVLSAVEGLEVVAPSLRSVVLPPPPHHVPPVVRDRPLALALEPAPLDAAPREVGAPGHAER